MLISIANASSMALSLLAVEEAKIAAVIGDDAPFPHFDDRAGNVAGEDRLATRTVLEALAPPPTDLVDAVAGTVDWTYARALVLERWCGAGPGGAELIKALETHVHALAAAALPPAPGGKETGSAPNARRVLPFLVRSCAHLGPCVVALAPLAGRGPLRVKDRVATPPKDLGAATRLPPALALGPLRALAERTTYLPLGACSSVLRRDADAMLQKSDPQTLEASLRELRRRIPLVAPPPAQQGLRDWDAPAARVLAAALTVVVARLFDGNDRASVEATQHALPTGLALLDASDAAMRFVGLECLVRVVTHAPAAAVDDAHPILLDALDRARALISRDGGGETVALYAHGAVVLIRKILEPSERRKAASTFMAACLDDLALWRDNAAKMELLRRVVDVIQLLGPHGAAPHLRRLLPCLLAAMDERAPPERRVVAIHALHVLLAQTWARAAQHRTVIVQALLLVAGQARRDRDGSAAAAAAAAAAGARPPPPIGFGPLAGLAEALAVRALALLLAVDGAAGDLAAAAAERCPELRPVVADARSRVSG